MAVFNASVQGWLQEAEGLGYNQKVIEYIKENPEKYFNPAANLYPRAWEYTSGLLNSHPMEVIVANIETVKDYLKDALGQEETDLFVEFILKH